MKKTVLASAVVVALCVAAPTAQQQPAPEAKTPPAHNVFVLTGCLKAGDTPATFKLIDALSVGQAPPAGAAEAGAVGTSGKASYLLRPVSGVDAQGMKEDALKAHLGQRVEAIVRPIESPASAPTASSAGAEAARPIEPAPQPFSVTEIRRVIGTCS